MLIDWQLIYTVLAFGSAAVSAALVMMVWQWRYADGAQPFMLVATTLSFWSLMYAFELASNDVAQMITFSKLAYVGIATFPTCWFIFALRYTTTPVRITRRLMALLAVIPSMTLILVWTNELHYLHWREITPVMVQDFIVNQVTYGPFFWIHALYSYGLILAATVLLLRMAFRTVRLYRRQAIILVVSTLIPWLGNVLHITNLNPVPGLDLTPASSIVAVTIIAWGLLRLNVFKDVTIARDTVVEGMDDGVIVLDSSNRVTDVNPAAQRLLGLARTAMIGRLPPQVFEHHPQVLKLYEALVNLSANPEIHKEAVLAQGETETFIEVRISPLKNQREFITGHLIVLQDITARKRAQEIAARRIAELAALRRVDERITGTLDIDDVLEIALTSVMEMSRADAGFISLVEAEQQRIVKVAGDYANEMIGQLFPFTVGIIGRVMRQQEAELVLDVQSDTDYRPFVLSTRAQMTIPLISHDKWIGVLNLETATPQHFTEEVFEFSKLLGGRIAGAVENAQLYTLSQNQLAELQTLYEQVSTLEQDKTDIIRIAAHDLRGPLGTIIGYLDLMQIDRDRLDVEHQDFVDTMVKLADRMDNLITDILSLERFSQGPVREPVDLRAVLCGLINHHEPQLTRKQLEIQTNILQSPLMVMGDPVQLREAMVNLLSNAIKYTPPGGRVLVSLQQKDKVARFEITDSGYGIPDELQDGLFHPFYRAVSSETKTIEGTGLGLHLVKKIIERHQGRVHFHSVYGEGSTFGFELLLKPAS